MTFNRYTEGFDQCGPPSCPEDVIVEITNKTCTNDNTLHIEWTVVDRYNRNLDLNSVLWSCDNQNFNNTSYPENDFQPYETSFDVSSCEGIIYLKAKVRIGTTLIESKVETCDTALCDTISNLAVPAIWCGDCPDTVSNPPLYLLYVRSMTVPSYPAYFDYGGFCWHLTNDNNEVSTDDLPEGAILTDIDTSYLYCNDCCLKLDCPSSWVELSADAQETPGERVGVFYFEYQTTICPDRFYVIKNFVDSDCTAAGAWTPESDKILFDTGCIATSLEEGPSFFAGNHLCLDYGEPTYGFCLTVREGDLPIGIVNDCDCSDNCNTTWKICSVDPDGSILNWEGSNECLCEEI
jgi:hypothetical protein